MKEEIAKFFKGDLMDDMETLQKYSRDASLFTVFPKLIAFPKDSEDVKNIVKWVSDNKVKYPDLSITARSAGTDMTGGPLGESIILDFTKYMNRLISFDSQKMEITVLPGMYYRDFEKIVSEKKLMLPSYPSSKSICAIGGMFANNSGGEKSLRYGKTENYIMSSKIVLSDGNEYEIRKEENNQNFLGEIYKNLKELIKTNEAIIKKAKPNVSKNSAGYYIWNAWNGKNIDLNKLLVGSQGTLGITTEITFQLVSIVENTRLVVIYLNDFNKISELVNEVLKYDPESLESYDDKTLKIAIKFFTSFLKGRGLWGSLKFAWSFWPDLFMLLKHGFPKIVVLAELSGTQEDINKKYFGLKKYLDRENIFSRISKTKTDTQKYWDIRHESFNLLRKHVKGKKTAPFIDDVIVRPEFLPKFLPELENILSLYPELEHTIAGHPGDGNFHIIPLVDINDQKIGKDVLEVSEKVYDLVKKYNGSITAEHNDGIVRTPYLSKMYSREVIEIFQKIKNIFDPKNIFNPGKKVEGTKEYIFSHLTVK